MITVSLISMPPPAALHCSSQFISHMLLKLTVYCYNTVYYYLGYVRRNVKRESSIIATYKLPSMETSKRIWTDGDKQVPSHILHIFSPKQVILSPITADAKHYKFWKSADTYFDTISRQTPLTPAGAAVAGRNWISDQNITSRTNMSIKVLIFVIDK